MVSFISVPKALRGDSYVTEITNAPENTFLVEQDSQERLFALAGNDVYRSLDDGNSWSLVLDNTNRTDSYLFLHVDSRDYIFTTIYDGQWKLERSADHGDTWSNVWSGYAIWEMDEFSDGSLLFNTYSTGHSYLVQSNDGGATWVTFWDFNAYNIDHIHAVAIDDYTDDIYIATGDGQYQSTIQRFNTTLEDWDILANDTQTILIYQTAQITFDSTYVYFWADANTRCYRMHKAGTGSDDFEQIFDTSFFRSAGDSNFIYEAVRTGELTFFGTDEGQLWASWDCEHWVKIYDGGINTMVRKISINNYPYYFTNSIDSPYGGTLYRLPVTKGDLIRLFYSEYNLRLGDLTNTETYVLEQRVHNGSNYIDLTSVALSNAQASIIGLDRVNEILSPSCTPNAGFEWNNKTGWQINNGATTGYSTITNAEACNGTYSLNITKSSGDTFDNTIQEPSGTYTTVNRGEMLFLSFYVKANISASNTVKMGWRSDTSGSVIQYFQTLYDVSTDWQRLVAWYVPYRNTALPVNLRLNLITLKGADIQVFYDSFQLQKFEVGMAYNAGATSNEIGYFEKMTPFSYHTTTMNTENPSVIIAGQTISHTGTLANGSESSATALSGSLSGAIEISATIQGSGQAILKLTGTRVLYGDSIILQGSSPVYYGRYYGSVSLTATLTTPVLLVQLNASLSNITYTGGSLSFILTAPYGSAITYVYCGSKGEPKSVFGATSWSYDPASMMLTISELHFSPARMLIYWNFPGDIDGDNYVDVHDLFLLAESYGAHLGDPSYNTDRDIDLDGDIDADDLHIFADSYGRH